MAKIERWRETVSELPTEEEVRRKADQGWKLAAVEWRRESPGEAESAPGRETPFGLLTREGATDLEPNRYEEEALGLMLGMVIDDRNSLAKVAEELNRRGFKTRGGQPWNQCEVFKMMPRLVEVAPSLFNRADGSAGKALTTH